MGFTDWVKSKLTGTRKPEPQRVQNTQITKASSTSARRSTDAARTQSYQTPTDSGAYYAPSYDYSPPAPSSHHHHHSSPSHSGHDSCPSHSSYDSSSSSSGSCDSGSSSSDSGSCGGSGGCD